MKRRRKRTNLTKLRQPVAIVLVLLLIIGVSWASCHKKKAQDTEQVQQNSPVIINEVMSGNTGNVSDAAGNHPDYIELYNTSSEDQDISGWGLSDREDRLWIFPDRTVVPAGGYILVWCTGEEVENALVADFKLSAGDVLRLTNAAGEPLFTMEVPEVYSGYTLSWDEDQGQYIHMPPSPLYPNTREGAAAYEASRKVTEGEGALSLGTAAHHNGVYISEFMARNGITTAGPNGAYPDWVELFNTTNGPVDLGGCGISDDASKPYKFTFPQGTVLAAGEYLLLWCMPEQMDGYISLPFNLSGKGDTVVLTSKEGGILDMCEFGAMDKDYSMARTYLDNGDMDTAGDFLLSDKPTPGYPNTNAGYNAFDQQRNPDMGVHDITFSEVLSDGYRYRLNSTNTPDDNDLGKWVELYNKSDMSVDLTGYTLTDNDKKPDKWVFPEGTSIAGKGYLILYMSGSLPLEGQKESTVTADMKLRTLNFSIADEGETLYLYDRDQTLIDRVSVPAATACVSFAKVGSTWGLCDTPTPGAANTGSLMGVTYCEVPSVALKSGVYHGPQTITIEVPQGCYVTYTLDATTPTETSTRYRAGEELTFNSNAVLRARSFSTDGTQYKSPVMSETYIIVGEEQTTDAHDSTLPVCFLVTDPDNLFNVDYGIYVVGSHYQGTTEATEWTTPSNDRKLGANYNQRGREWERPAHWTYTSAGGREVLFESDLMIRIFGSFSRYQKQKNFALIARKGYGGSTLDYPFFPNRPFESYESLVLRCSAKDAVASKIRDCLMTGLLEDGGVDLCVQAYVQTALYLNGQYWGVYNLREKVSRAFIAQHYSITNKDSIDTLRGNGVYVAGDPKAADEYAELIKFCESKNCDLSNYADYEYVCSKVDVENYALYCVAEIIVGNNDSGNIKWWRSSEKDGKWRWIYYDFCDAMARNDEKEDAYTNGYRRDFFSKYFHPDGHGAGKGFSTVLSRSLLKNNDFVEIFLKYCALLANDVYSPEKINAKVDDLAGAIEEEIKWDFPRWGLTVKNWSAHVGNIRGYANHYQEYFFKYLKNYINTNTNYRLTDSKMLELFGRTE
ncbi:MAG: lamin tail domain-containing protein [Clostridia bacterium]|nr:lamin tail domain-containing protein [Clostridia bacterium]